MTRIRRHMTFANVVSIMALVFAMGGTGYAALKLPKNSVGGAQIKKNAVTGAKVKNSSLGPSDIKNGSLLKADFKAGQLPAGATGATGATGPAGAAGANGTADAYARVQANGTLLTALEGFPATSKGVVNENITNPAVGTYCFQNLPFRPASATVSSDNAGAVTPATNNVVISVATERGNNLNGCPAGADARVVATQWTEAAAPANVNKGFVIWFEG